MQSRKLIPLGAVTVAAVGAKQRFTAGLATPSADLRSHWIFVQASKANTGIVYVGDSAVTSTKYIVALSPGEAIGITSAQLRGTDGCYFLNDFYADTETAGNSLQVSYDASRD